MSSPEFEKFLAVLYTDIRFYEQFIQDCDSCFSGYDLNEAEKQALRTLDRERLNIQIDILKTKRDHKPKKPRPWYIFWR